MLRGMALLSRARAVGARVRPLVPFRCFGRSRPAPEPSPTDSAVGSPEFMHTFLTRSSERSLNAAGRPPYKKPEPKRSMPRPDRSASAPRRAESDQATSVYTPIPRPVVGPRVPKPVPGKSQLKPPRNESRPVASNNSVAQTPVPGPRPGGRSNVTYHERRPASPKPYRKGPASSVDAGGLPDASLPSVKPLLPGVKGTQQYLSVIFPNVVNTMAKTLLAAASNQSESGLRNTANIQQLTEAQQAESVLDKQLSKKDPASLSASGVSFDPNVIGKLYQNVRDLAQRNDMAAVKNIIAETRQKYGAVPEILYRPLIVQYCKLRLHHEVNATLEAMKADGIVLGVQTYTSVMHFFAKLRQLEHCEEFFRRMVENKVEPTVVTYSVLVWAALQCANASKALEYHAEMEARGIESNVVVYGTLLNGLGKLDEWDRVSDVWKEAKARKMVMGRKVLLPLFALAARKSQLQLCFETLQLMVQQDLWPPFKQVSLFIDKTVKRSDSQTILTFFDILLSRNKDSLSTGCSQFILAVHFARPNELEPCVEMLDRMVAAKCNPSPSALLALLRSVYHRNIFLLAERAYHIYRKAVALGLDRSSYPYLFSVALALISVRVRGPERLAELDTELKEMLDLNCPISNSSLIYIMRIYVRNTAWERAEDMLRDLSNLSSPDTEVIESLYQMLISGLFAHQLHFRALALLELYKAKGLHMTAPLYNTLIRNFLEARLSGKADEYIQDMRAQGYMMELATYNVRIHSLAKQNRFDDAVEVLAELRASGLSPDVRTWHALFEACAMCRQLDVANALFTVADQECSNSNTKEQLRAVWNLAMKKYGFYDVYKPVRKFVPVPEHKEEDHAERIVNRSKEAQLAINLEQQMLDSSDASEDNADDDMEALLDDFVVR